MAWLANYHTHSHWCDGEGEIAEVVAAGLAAGLTAIGISSHAPVPFPAGYALPLDHLRAYRDEVLRVRELYAGRIDVILGLELDALPELRRFNEEQALALGFDYTVGSVHFQQLDDAGEPWPLDLSDARFAALVRERYAGNVRALVEEHYERIAELADYPGVAIVGHIDRGVKLWNAGGRYFSEDTPWYRAAVERALRALAATGRIVELSTGGWRRGLPDPFPSPWIVRRCRDLGVRMTLNSDSHHPSQLVHEYPRALALLRETCHGEIARFDPARGDWALAPLPTA
ncbi:MAG: Histidinol-phosphatase [uncultured Thermomicrobiales bacterium]|uniref:Histidinol-phosphatase n=1 Tax=uncultured Thermomicrobiales bacterium TaxID=1645740 RepID=A0A6J4UY45_9BACT|nr:MAG: Histidinol-phosphatase [uncultured Thermomicrobiales bacterium]